MAIIARPKLRFPALPRSPKLHYSWVILGILAVVQIVGQSIGMAAGIMVAPLNDPNGDFGWSIGTIGAGLATYYLVGAIASPISGWLADRYGAHKTLVAAGALFALSMVLLAFITSLWHLFLVFGVMLAVTQSLSMVPLIAAMSRWFRRRHGLGVGILWAAGGLGAAGLAPLIGYLLEHMGWQTTFLAIGIGGSGVILLLAPFFRNRPADLGINAYGVSSDETPEIGWSKVVENLRVKVFNKHIRSTKEFWNLPLIHGLGCAGHGIILIYSIPFAVEHGISLTAATLILSLINIFSIASRFATPIVAEWVGPKLAMVTALSLQGLTVLVLFWAQDTWSFYLFAVLFGIGFGGEMSAYPVVNRQYFGSGPIGTFYGIEIMGALLGHAVATALAGFVIYIVGSYTPILIMSMGFSAVGVLMILNLAPGSHQLIPNWEDSLPPEAKTPLPERSRHRAPVPHSEPLTGLE